VSHSQCSCMADFGACHTTIEEHGGVGACHDTAIVKWRRGRKCHVTSVAGQEEYSGTGGVEVPQRTSVNN
jgi:hypothetical protein